MAALIAAAGAGERLGLGPKALVKVGGTTLLELVLAAVRGRVDEVVVAVPAGSPGHWPEAGGVRYVDGGATRQASVKAMLAATDAEQVVVHDVARPFLPAAVLGRVVAAVREHGAASAAMSIPDTVVTADGRELDRASLFAVQTPQGFERDLLVEAHEAAEADGFKGTDDAGLVRRIGRHVELVEGSALLMKLTRPGDLEVAEAMLALSRGATR